MYTAIACSPADGGISRNRGNVCVLSNARELVINLIFKSVFGM